jgi:NitT/TauT family transport system substrate-binding protein
MTDARMKSFFDKMTQAGVVTSSLDYQQGYTLKFIGKKVGMEVKPTP